MKFFKNIQLVLLVSFSSFIISQEINEAFLMSLPDNLRGDFEKRIAEQNNADEIYVNPDTRLKNLEAELIDAELSLSRVRESLQGKDPNYSELKRFGDSFFSTYQSTFAPINQPNAGYDYILDGGDKLEVQLVGQVNKEHKVYVNRDGNVNIPDVGMVNVMGLNLQEARSLILKKVQEVFVGVNAYVSLTEMRDLNVLVVGSVNNPGMYTVSGGSTPLSLISASGGVNQNGSYRKISHKRKNKLLQNIDLYEILVNGNLTFDYQLRSGDVLVVHPKLSEVRVSGSFANPGIYEVLPEESLVEILKVAGARKSIGISLSRYENNQYKLIEINDPLKDDISLKDGDAIALKAIEPEFNKIKSITLSGEIKVPGKYYISDDMRLSDLLKQAGLFTDNAYPEAGVFSRESVKTLESDFKEKSYNQLINFVISTNQLALSGPGMSDNIITLLSLLKDYKPVGRLLTSFNISELESNKSLNRILQDGDKIHIPTFSPEVYVFGEVMSPGALSFDSEFSLNDYINGAGDFSRLADRDRLIVVNPDGSINKVSGGSLFSGVFRSPSSNILPGSTIYVPAEVGKIDGINLAATVSPIFSSFALSLASLNSINN